MTGGVNKVTAPVIERQAIIGELKKRK